MMRIASILLLAMAAFGQEKPVCGENNRGQFWPSEANSDRVVLKQALNCGELRICSKGLWKYRWETVGATYWQLAKQPAPAACKLAEPAGEPETLAAGTRE